MKEDTGVVFSAPSSNAMMFRMPFNRFAAAAVSWLTSRSMEAEANRRARISTTGETARTSPRDLLMINRIVSGGFMTSRDGRHFAVDERFGTVFVSAERKNVHLFPKDYLHTALKRASPFE